MHHTVRGLIIFTFIFVFIVFFNLGMDWINFGHGLNPIIAFPIATISFIAAVLTPKVCDILEELKLINQPLTEEEIREREAAKDLC